MVFADWEFFSDFTPNIEALDTSNFIDGASSLRVFDPAGPGPEGWHAQVVTGGLPYTRGLTYGKVRTLLKFLQATGGQVDGIRAGIFCMSSTSDISSTGSAYFMSIYPDTVDNVHMWKLTSGLDQHPTLGATQQLFEASKSLTIGTTVAVELEWRADSVQIGGTRLIGRVGNSITYGDLTEVFDIVDGSAFFSTTAEGLAVSRNSTPSALIDIIFDNTTIFSFT
jgi:hypothetical protein